MQAQGPAFNGDYIRALTSRISTATSCRHLEEIALEASPSMQAIIASIGTAQAQVAELEALLAPPSDLPSLLTWAGKIITLIVGPQVRPLVALAEQATQATAELAELAAAVATAKARFAQCEFTVPGLG